MKSYDAILQATYSHFNNRDIDATLKSMDPEVDWPNGMEGGIEHGHDAVRSYWTRQWKLVDPHVEPLRFNLEEDGRVNVEVHQVVRDLNGNLLIDQMIHHIYRFRDNLILAMEIQSV